MNNSCVVIIGAVGQIGRAISKGLIDYGKNVILSDINSSVHDFARNLTSTNSKNAIFTFQSNITIDDDLFNLIKFSESNFLKIDGVINLAYPRGDNWGLPLNEVNYQVFCENINPHLGGYFNVMKIFSDYFSRNNGGAIINLASIYGIIPPKFEIYKGTELSMPVEYAAIKSAIIHMGKFFAQKYKKNNVRVNSISPGGVYSDHDEVFVRQYGHYTGSTGLLSAEEIVPSVLFLLDEKNKSITGQNICIDNGFSL